MPPPIAKRPKDASAAWESLHSDPEPVAAKPHREAGEIHVAYDFKNGPAAVRVTDIRISLRSMMWLVFKFYLAASLLSPIIFAVALLGVYIFLTVVGGYSALVSQLLPS